MNIITKDPIRNHFVIIHFHHIRKKWIGSKVYIPILKTHESSSNSRGVLIRRHGINTFISQRNMITRINQLIGVTGRSFLVASFAVEI